MKNLELHVFRNQVLCNVFSKKFQIINIILKMRMKLFQIDISVHVHKKIPEFGCKCEFLSKSHWENVVLAKYQDSFSASLRALQSLTGNYPFAMSITYVSETSIYLSIAPFKVRSFLFLQFRKTDIL
jgi:hypothetical protein